MDTRDNSSRETESFKMFYFVVSLLPIGVDKMHTTLVFLSVVQVVLR